jgi:hypothetical protein
MTEAIVSEVNIVVPEGLAVEDIRAIIRVTASVEIVAHYMIEMITGIADRYFLLIHKVASQFLPAPLLSKLDKKNYIIEKPRTEEAKIIQNEIHHYIDSIFSTSDLRDYLVPGTVLIFPDDIMLRFFEKAIPSDMKEGVGVFPINLTPAKRVRSWIESYEKKYDIIF